MFASIKNFVSRHRRKFIIGGAVVGGFVFLTHYTQRKLAEWQEREFKEFMERTQRQQHFEKNERTCNQTILSLTPTLCDTVGKLLDSDSILDKLRNGVGDKLTLWEDLKIAAFTRLSLLLYGGTFFVILLRIQVNLIGGYLYYQSTSGHNYSDDESDKKLQEDYLKLCEYFLTKGVKDLCSLIEGKVRLVLEGESLKKQLTLQDIERYFWAIQSAISSDPDDPLKHLSKHLLPRDQIPESADKSMLRQIVNETIDIIESDEIKSLATSCVSRGFAQIMDRISEFFCAEIPTNQLAIPGTSSGINGTLQNNNWSNDFLNYKKMTMPMAKVIPIVNGLTKCAKPNGSSKESYEQWILQFINLHNLKLMGANIYESYSHSAILS